MQDGSQPGGSRRDLAERGIEIGEDENARLWKTALRALASRSSALGRPPTDSRVQESAAAQVYAEVSDDVETRPVRRFVEAFVGVYGLETLEDVNDLLGRESHERDNYSGQVALVGAE